MIVMTKGQALEETRKMTMHPGAVREGTCFLLSSGECFNHGAGCPGGRPWFEVGEMFEGQFCLGGRGDSWEAAIAAFAMRRLVDLERR